MYFNDLWIGFLCEQIIRQCVQISKLRCPGCEDKMKSPLLHLHEQHSLLDKLHLYFEEIRGAILPTVNELYSHIEQKLPHSEDMTKDRECYISNGRQFLLTITSDALFYGRYINEFMDGLIDETFKVPKKRKANQVTNVKRKATT